MLPSCASSAIGPTRSNIGSDYALLTSQGISLGRASAARAPVLRSTRAGHKNARLSHMFCAEVREPPANGAAHVRTILAGAGRARDGRRPFLELCKLMRGII